MANSNLSKRIAVLVGGGPAPGINSVISAVTIEALNNGYEVIGIRDGFKHLAAGDISHTHVLNIENTIPYYNRGGSMLGTSRTNPAKKAADMQHVLNSLDRLDIHYLVTIGGDDTAFSASQVYKQAEGRIRVAHVPKTIDNDLPLPPGIPTFGFETARHYGVQLSRNLHEDAKTTTRWYLIVSMGRAAGHLALGIGKASAATLTIITEEFRDRPVTISHICDIIIGSIVKRRYLQKEYGLVVMAEGLIEAVGEKALIETFGDNLAKYGTMERDPFGHLRLGEIDFGHMIRDQLEERLLKLGIKSTMIVKVLGYELRCADPIPFDVEYTRNLGYGAVKFLMSSEADHYGAIVCSIGGKMVPLKFEDMIVPETMKMRPRLVDADSETYECARRYMTRLEKSDFEDPVKLAGLAAVLKMTPEQFAHHFGYLAKD